jgi:fatty acid desaturase
MKKEMKRLVLCQIMMVIIIFMTYLSAIAVLKYNLLSAHLVALIVAMATCAIAVVIRVASSFPMFGVEEVIQVSMIAILATLVVLSHIWALIVGALVIFVAAIGHITNGDKNPYNTKDWGFLSEGLLIYIGLTYGHLLLK